jgi:ornithine cyclodeaminase/alanine dehydrogenase-like protein (mu-crystallin family)
MTRADVHAELAELVAGSKPGRNDDAQITLFDSTGTAVQDVAAAVRIYQRAVADGAGVRTALGG